MKFSIGRLWAVALLAAVIVGGIGDPRSTLAQPGVVNYGGSSGNTNPPGVWDLVTTNGGINTLGVSRWAGTNIFDVIGTTTNCGLLHAGSWTFYKSSTNTDLTNALAAAVAGDQIHMNTNALVLSNSFNKAGVSLIGRGPLSEIVSWIALSNGTPVQLRSNATYYNFRVTDRRNNEAGVFDGSIGGRDVDGNPGWGNVYIGHVIATNGNSDSLYVSEQTNYTSALVENSQFRARWDSGAMFITKTSIWSYAGNTWMVRNPSPLNTAGENHAWWATGGTNLHYNSTFDVSGTPTSSMTYSNNYAAALRNDTGSAMVFFRNCTFLHAGATTAAGVVREHHSFGNLLEPATSLLSSFAGVTNEPGVALFDVLPDNSVTGRVSLITTPLSAGIMLVDDTNTLYVCGSGGADDDHNVTYTNTGSANLPQSGVPGYLSSDGNNLELAITNTVPVLIGQFGGIAFTNRPGAFYTNTGWGDATASGPPPAAVRFRRVAQSFVTCRDLSGVLRTNVMSP